MGILKENQIKKLIIERLCFLWSVVMFSRFEMFFCNGLICKRLYEKHVPGVFSSDFVSVSTPFNASFVALIFWWILFIGASIAKWESSKIISQSLNNFSFLSISPAEYKGKSMKEILITNNDPGEETDPYEEMDEQIINKNTSGKTF